jgi:cytoskeletal protein CcmA (bactofilin family)
MSAPEIPLLLDAASRFHGKLSCDGAARIDGALTGEVRSNGQLWIGPTATIRAEITGAQVVVEGEVRGDIVASQSIEIRAPARVFGNLSAPSLSIGDGSVFEGQCRRDAPCEPADG